MTCEMTKQLLGLISSPANRSTPSHTPRPSTQKLQIAFQPLKPSQEVLESTKEELPSCVFSGQHPLIKSLGKEQESQPLMGSGFREALMPRANQGQQGKDQGLSIKAQLLMPAVWIWPFRQKSVRSQSWILPLFLFLLLLILFFLPWAMLTWLPCSEGSKIRTKKLSASESLLHFLVCSPSVFRQAASEFWLQHQLAV